MEKTIELFHEIRVSGKWESAQNAEIKANNQSLTIMSVCTFEKFAARLSVPKAAVACAARGLLRQVHWGVYLNEFFSRIDMHTNVNF